MSDPIFASGSSTDPDLDAAVDEACAELDAGLGERRADLLVCFASPHHQNHLERLGPRLKVETGAGSVVGCSGQGVVAARRELEGGPGLALWAVASEALRVTVFDTLATQAPSGQVEFTRFPEVGIQKNPSLLLLGDPFSFPMAHYLEAVDRLVPGLPAIGGMASGGQSPGTIHLVRESGLQPRGAIAVLLQGGIELTPVVSQGCRPVGRPYVITRAEDNLICQLGGKPAARVLHQALGEMPPEDANLFRRGPFLGLALDPTKSTFERDDFLVRGILGHRSKDDALAVGDGTLRVGMTVQFLVRDAASASEDLNQLMGERSAGSDPNATGALLFSCNGRGSRMFGEPHHDIRGVQSAFESPVPAAGFFANGEIGPVGGRNFLHGFTASVALFRGAGVSERDSAQ